MTEDLQVRQKLMRQTFYNWLGLFITIVLLPNQVLVTGVALHLVNHPPCTLAHLQNE